jgi:hypothetical protein
MTRGVTTKYEGMMDTTQAQILIAMSYRLTTICGLILLVLLFGSPIRRKVEVETVGDTEKAVREGEQVFEATHPRATMKVVSRANAG